jgi:hypothetical protein
MKFINHGRNHKIFTNMFQHSELAGLDCDCPVVSKRYYGNEGGESPCDVRGGKDRTLIIDREPPNEMENSLF